MISLNWSGEPTGAVAGPFPTDPIRNAETESIRRYVAAHAHKMTGRVLDFGAGKPGTCRQPQPYRELILGEYCPYDIGDTLEPLYDSILCTQVLSMVEPAPTLRLFRESIHRGGYLLLSYESNWEDYGGGLWRYTPAGMTKLLEGADFAIENHDRRAEVKLGSFRFALGYGCLARAI